MTPALEARLTAPRVSVEDMYRGTQRSYDNFLAVLDESLGPRSPDVLYDKFGDLGPTPESLVLDAGCRHAVQACELSTRFRCRVVGIDLVGDNISEARSIRSLSGCCCRRQT